MRLNLRSFFSIHTQGQSLVFIALILPFIVMLCMTAIEVATRFMEVAEIEDALRQASRSSVQLLDYSALAEDGQRVDQQRVVQTARTLFLTNLKGVRGLAETPETLVERVEWQIYTEGGSCTLPGEGAAIAGRAERVGRDWRISFATPAVCASVQPKLTGLFGWGVYTPQINAAETLDVIQ